MSKSKHLLAAFSILLSVSAGAAWGQVSSATITGSVKDPVGRVVPKAKITVTEETTGVITHAVTNATGEYTPPLRKPGTYDLVAGVRPFDNSAVAGVLYPIEMGWPTDQQVVIHALGFDQLGAPTKIHSVRLLGSSQVIAFEQEADGLHLHFPMHPPTRDAASFRIDFEPLAGATK